MREDKPWVVVPGIPGAIGRAIAQRCILDGYHVLAVGRSRGRLLTWAKSITIATDDSEAIEVLEADLAAPDLPALSGVVVLDGLGEPGGGFWGGSPNVPRRPANDVARIAEYGRIMRGVYAAPWPEQFPLGAPA
jgi:NAD(P)-dependent dehydrogenase (short-subunit alcohol dehydrogenase family)